MRTWTNVLILTALVACSRQHAASRNEGAGGGSAANGPEAYYRELIARSGKQYDQCLKTARLATPPPAPVGETQPERAKNVVLAIDSSGSMAAKVQGVRKIDAAKDAATQFLGSLPPDVNAGLVAYGHKGDNTPAHKAESCQGVEVVYAPAPFEAERFTSAVRAFEPTGWTPLAAAIDQAGAALPKSTGSGELNVVYVVSDGLETCGGRPVDAARRLHAADVKTIVNVISFDVGNRDQRELRAIAEAGAGSSSRSAPGTSSAACSPTRETR